MKKNTSAPKMEESMLEKLATRVQDLYLKTQTALPVDRTKAHALYRRTYLAYRAHQIFVMEQDALLLISAH